MQKTWINEEFYGKKNGKQKLATRIGKRHSKMKNFIEKDMAK